MPLIETGGPRLHVQALGAGERVPVVLLHGLLVGSLATWYFTLAPVLAKHRRVILYDLRGHGRSEVPAKGYAIADHLRDLEAVLAAEGLTGPYALVGHSFGGLVALHHALAAPEKVSALALVEMPLPPSQAGVVPEASDATVDPEALLGSLPAPVRESVASGGRRGRRFLERIRALVEDTDLLSALAAMDDLEDAHLSGLATPTLALYGEDSSCLPTGERLARLLPRATLRRLPGGHFLPVESPVAVTSAVEEFFGGVLDA